MAISYSDRFQPSDSVADYDGAEYGAESYATSIWHLQQVVIENIVRRHKEARPGPIRLLDFACGTGRVLAALEPLVAAADGVDISPNMVAVARTKCQRARLQVGDILEQPGLLNGSYELISCFRFLLNAEPRLRAPILARLRSVIAFPQGLLLINVHGNSRSLRHPAILWRRWRARQGKDDAMLNEMSPTQARQLLTESGFEVEQQFGFGIFPQFFYRTPLRPLVQTIDRKLAGDNFWRNWSIDMLFVCRPKQDHPGPDTGGEERKI